MKKKLFENIGGNHFKLVKESEEPQITEFRIKDLGIKKPHPNNATKAMKDAENRGEKLAIGYGTHGEDAAFDALDKIEGGGTEKIEQAIDNLTYRDDLTTSQVSAEYGGDIEQHEISYIIYIYYKPVIDAEAEAYQARLDNLEYEEPFDGDTGLDRGTTYQDDYEDRVGPQF